jgi:hypothetical protein
MKKQFTIIALALATSVFGQGNFTNQWNMISEGEVKVAGERQIVPSKYKVYHLSFDNLISQLLTAPMEHSTNLNESNCVITLPAPNGEMQLFKVVESPVMAAPLAASFPDIRTYSIKGITDRFASGKIDFNEFGFHGMIRSVNGDYFIDPYCLNNTSDYISYYVSDFSKPAQHRMPEVGVLTTKIEEENKGVAFKANAMPPAACSGANLRTYRLAVACTGEYAVAATGSATPTKAQTLAKIVTTINRVDGVYETEVAVRLVLVATQTDVVFTSASTDPFTGNNNAVTLISESQSVITNTIGTANFDIGHTFSTGGGGLAGLGVVCSASQKGRGITGSSSPVGDPYDIDYVAHEMGHQFSGNHTFNCTESNCGGGNRNASTAVEPGSGITIMGYAGICGSNDLAPNSIAYFHAISYDEIVNFTTLGGGNGCAVTTTSGNQPPSVTAGGAYVIPASTPFTLTGTATDPNNDPLTYSWEQTNTGVAGNWNSGNRPFFRSYVPSTSPTRLFPILNSVLTSNYTTVKGEYLPSTTQTLNFRLTARDNKMGGGGVCYATATVNVNATAGPFQITYPNTTGIVWGMGMQQNVTWDVNNTNVAPVNTASVNILISYNSGNTFTTLVANTANDGIEVITVPTLTADVTTCRIKVEAVGNVYYDINQPNFTIAANVTGISEVSGNNSLAVNVYPNPFDGKINLKVGALSAEVNTTVKIVDVLGKTLKVLNYGKVNLLSEELDLTTFEKGVYFITVSNAGTQTTARVIKN